MDGVWSRLRGRLGVAAWGTFVVVGAVAGVTAGLPTAVAGPATDGSGFVDSTARCVSPSKAVAFGYTASSRVAICKDDGSGQYQYRGVRVSDGARLILAATSTDKGFVAENDGITYTVTPSALIVTAGGQQVRNEPMIEFYGTAGGAATPTTSTPARSTATPSTTVQPSAAPEPVTPSTPLPPPLPAEVGGGGH